MTFASVVLQDVTFTEKKAGSLVTVTYAGDAVAGAEYVTTSMPSHDIVIHISSGVTLASTVKTIVDAHIDSSALVSVEVTGTPTNAQVTTYALPLANGTAVTKASKRIGAILFEAKTAGTAGNSVRVKYTSGASLTVSVASSDITIQIIDGVSTTDLIMAAVRASSPANALVRVEQAAGGNQAQYVHYASAFTALAGGLAAAVSSVVIQDITVSTRATGSALNGVPVSYTAGATAGSEVVTSSAAGVSVQIEDGVSTATQVADALNAAASFTGAKAQATITYGAPDDGDTVIVNGSTFTKVAAAPGAGEFSDISELEALVEAVTGVNSSQDGTDISIIAADFGTAGNAITLALGTNTGTMEISGNTLTGGTDAYTVAISGTGSNTQNVYHVLPTTGAVGDPQTLNQTESDVALTSSFVYQEFGFGSYTAFISNNETSGTKTVVVSVNGVDIVDTLSAGQAKTYSYRQPHTGVYLKYGVGAPAYLLQAQAV